MKKLPLVYSCSGCSSAAQMANDIALRLDREGIAEMSCIVGVGGRVGPLVKKAGSAHAIVGLDGCGLACVENCLKQQNLRCDLHFDLSELDVAKHYHSDYDKEEAERVYQAIKRELEKKLG